MSSNQAATHPPHITDNAVASCPTCRLVKRKKDKPIQVVTHLTKTPLEPDFHATIRWNHSKLLEPSANWFSSKREQTIEEHDHYRCAGYSMASKSSGARCKKILGEDRAKRLPNMNGTGQAAYLAEGGSNKVLRYFCANHMENSGLNRAANQVEEEDEEEGGEEEEVQQEAVAQKSNAQKTQTNTEKPAKATKPSSTQKSVGAQKINGTEKPAKVQNTKVDAQQKPTTSQKSATVPKTSGNPKASEALKANAKALKTKSIAKQSTETKKASKGKSGRSDPLSKPTSNVISIPANERLTPDQLIPDDEDEEEALELQAAMHQASETRIMQLLHAKIKALQKTKLPEDEIQRREMKLWHYFYERIQLHKRWLCDMIDVEVDVADEIVERPYSPQKPKQRKLPVIVEEGRDIEMQEQTAGTETEKESAATETVPKSKKRSRGDFEKGEKMTSPTTEQESAEPVPIPARKKTKTNRVAEEQEITPNSVAEEAPGTHDSAPDDKVTEADGAQEQETLLRPIPEEEPEMPASALQDQVSEKVDAFGSEEEEDSSSVTEGQKSDSIHEDEDVDATSSLEAEQESVSPDSVTKTQEVSANIVQTQEKTSASTPENVAVSTGAVSPAKKRKAEGDLDQSRRKVTKLSTAGSANDEDQTKPSDGETQSPQTALGDMVTTEAAQRKSIGGKTFAPQHPAPDDSEMEDSAEEDSMAADQGSDDTTEEDEDDETIGRKSHGNKSCGRKTTGRKTYSGKHPPNVSGKHPRKTTTQQNLADEDVDMEDDVEEDDTVIDEESDDESESSETDDE